MRTLRAAVLLSLSVGNLAAVASAQPADEGSAFATEPVSDVALANVYGTGVRGITLRGARLVNDQYSLNLLQNAGQTSRVSLDAWWSQPGAALIDNNLLAVRATR